MATSASSTSTKRQSGKEVGFTLLELVVVIGIIVILTSMVAGYSREGGRQLALVSTETKMLNLLNRAKFLSIETFFGGGRKGDERICAYGVKVDTANEEMFIFQDLSTEASCPGNSNGVYDEGEQLAGELNEIKLQSTSVAFSGETNLSEVIFIPPDPQTKIKKSDTSEVSEAKLFVKLREGDGRFIISVNNAGQIKAE